MRDFLRAFICRQPYSITREILAETSQIVANLIAYQTPTILNIINYLMALSKYKTHGRLKWSSQIRKNDSLSVYVVAFPRINLMLRAVTGKNFDIPFGYFPDSEIEASSLDFFSSSVAFRYVS